MLAIPNILNIRQTTIGELKQGDRFWWELYHIPYPSCIVSGVPDQFGNVPWDVYDPPSRGESIEIQAHPAATCYVKG